MKTHLTALLVGFSLVAITTRVSAQQSTPSADSTLLSEKVEGDYHIKHYLVHTPADADFVLHYRINSAMLNRAMDNNAAQLQQVDHVVSKVMADTLNRVQRVHIVGYASPDGTLAGNKTLSQRRAVDMLAYLDKNYQLSDHYPVTWNAEVASWASLHDVVASSAIPHRDSVLKILHGNHSEMQKEAALKRMPDAWRYLKTQILPPVRRVTMDVAYHQGEVVEQRVMIPKPTPKPAPASVPVSQRASEPEVVIVEEVIEREVDPCCSDFCNSEQVGVIVDMTGVEIDY